MREKPLPNQKPLPAATVFLSYAHVDLPLIEPIARAFDYWKWNVAWDQDNQNLGERWREILEPRVAAAYTLLVVWSKNSVTSEAVRTEIDWTLRRNTGLKFLPVMIEREVTPPEGLWTKEGVDLSEWDGEPHHPLFERVLDHIENPWTLDNGMALIRDIRALKTIKVVRRQKGPERPSD